LLALRVRLQGRPAFLDVLNLVRVTLQEAAVHQDLPFEELTRGLQAEGINLPPVQVIFQHVPYPVETLELRGLQVERWTVGLRPTKHWGLTLTVTEHSGQITAQLGYDAELYEAEGAAALLRQYLELLEKVADDPAHQIHPAVAGNERGGKQDP
jgi:non-ribosomal peptide synthetase component F